MQFEFRQTKYQVARGAKPDAEKPGKLLLIKRAMELHATYQIRLLTYRAVKENTRLVIEVPQKCKVHADLRDLVNRHPRNVKVVRD